MMYHDLLRVNYHCHGYHFLIENNSTQPLGWKKSKEREERLDSVLMGAKW